MLGYKRPHLSDTEHEFIGRFIDSIPNMQEDTFGNRFLKIGESSTMFSAHTDTVHWKSGRQNILYDPGLDVIYKDDNQPLGADNAAGIWVLLELIRAEVPGLYIFHRGEERGGQGSSWIADHKPDLLKDIKRAIAFDRRGTSEVITHQSSGRCCSDQFALALSKQLALNHAPSSKGIFTDTANYTHLIEECTNVSVGYVHEHTANETLDLTYLVDLADSAIQVDWDNLPVSREKTKDYDPWEYDNFTYFLDMCQDTPEIAAHLLELCDPSYSLISKAYETYGDLYERNSYDSRLDDRPYLYTSRDDAGFGEADFRTTGRESGNRR